mgnify:CR=1 FL=1
MSTGKNIKKVRKWRGITQEELGKALGIGEGSAGTRMKLESGHQKEKCCERLQECCLLIRNAWLPQKGIVKMI